MVSYLVSKQRSAFVSCATANLLVHNTLASQGDNRQSIMTTELCNAFVVVTLLDRPADR